MASGMFNVLLIGMSSRGPSHLTKHLRKQGCQCEFASSCWEARSLLQSHHFDMVLSPMRLRDTSLFPLVELLEGSDVSLFYSCPVEVGSWWLPALRRGEKCFGSPALRPSEFVSALDEAIDEVRANGRLAGTADQPVVQKPAALALCFAPPKSEHSVTAHGGAAMLARRKAS